MKKEIALCAIAAAVAGFLIGHFLFPRQDRFVITTTGQRIIKIDRHTGETWRYYRNDDGQEGFTRTADLP